MAQNLIERVLKTVRNYDMIKPGSRVLAAVSGGPDSTFLLYALLGLRRKLKIADIVACNLDHGLRGKESEEDSDFARKLAGELGVDFIHKKVSLKKSPVRDLSTEELAREARYAFFLDAAKKNSASAIATGHTLDDQAETILMRIIKGCSLKGVVGISPVREYKGIAVIRPLMELEKAEIKKYLDENNIKYRIDRSNLEPIYFRNVVRSEIIPFLEKYNPRLKRSLFGLAEHLREDFEFIESEKRRSGKLISRDREGRLEIQLKDMVLQPKTLQKEILRGMLEDAGGEVKKLTFRHWKEMENLIKRKSKGSSVDLPGDIRLTRSENALIFNKRI